MEKSFSLNMISGVLSADGNDVGDFKNYSDMSGFIYIKGIELSYQINTPVKVTKSSCLYLGNELRYSNIPGARDHQLFIPTIRITDLTLSIMF